MLSQSSLKKKKKEKMNSSQSHKEFFYAMWTQNKMFTK